MIFFSSLPKVTWNIRRQEINQVAERRKAHIEKFLDQLLSSPEGVAHCDLVYTFFHPTLTDLEETDIHIKKLKRNTDTGQLLHTVQGSLGVKVQYCGGPGGTGTLMVMITHGKNLPKTSQGQEPNPLVKVSLHPDRVDGPETTRKTKVCTKTCFPSFVEPVSQINTSFISIFSFGTEVL